MTSLSSFQTYSLPEKADSLLKRRNANGQCDLDAIIHNLEHNMSQLEQIIQQIDEISDTVSPYDSLHDSVMRYIGRVKNDARNAYASTYVMHVFYQSPGGRNYYDKKWVWNAEELRHLLQKKRPTGVGSTIPVKPSNIQTVVKRSGADPFGPMVPLYPEHLTHETLDYMKSHRYFSADEYIKQCDRFAKQRIPGCYIIYNCNTDKFYVGQAVDLMRRVKEHLNGRQSGGEQLDYDIAVLHHKVFIKHIPQLKSGYMDLNEMERCLIAAYDCVSPNGYNLTRGNGARVS